MTPQQNHSPVDAWRGEMSGNIKEVQVSLQQLLIEVRQRPTRAEVEAMISTKVSTELFNATIGEIRGDINDLRKKPAEAQAWTGTAMTVGGCLVGAAGLAISTIIGVITLIAPHWH
ncbi:hypothetical protein [Tengunoibacter tsumagoiensis]|uniref:Uncharacterized protein n=1 Tax=Tengunoibacter tsumagoiensis TaxID=2014871 RepID=A0A402A4Y4_9CHLR|nr:hypothetical protein [Tengunoibacter tsumagoiensis]GCE14208.1 hypothetical protein KTT_40670 [Tengunoibacter tsumagoiensis]GCE14262.1 hypothetical protein KTT_41210 [Tengunoibacter tsumagoiensis]